ncbi:hypothetical protein [Bacillus alkalicellulosilyticus]|uniref:hypothetical protein n=1 Tax=Alkalihalobacterium alkalicellulosilyticum TaxID=1912214 RepID=UPI0009978B80|nr:hypothetical protein [Bacillus alkalicellulosilyticus]
MGTFKPSLGTQTGTNKKPFITEVVRKKENDRKPSTTPKEKTQTIQRKIRSDKKKDIKIPLTLTQKQLLKKIARKNRTTVTQACTKLVEEGLTFFETFPEVDYENSTLTVHAKLSNFYSEQLFLYELEWDMSSRKAAHRILTYVMERNYNDYE